jgi:hypothetical protein
LHVIEKKWEKVDESGHLCDEMVVCLPINKVLSATCESIFQAISTVHPPDNR